MRLAANASISIVGTGGIRDYAGNPIQPFVLDFQASEPIAAGPFRWTLIEPRANPAPRSAVPVVEFDRTMDAASVVASMRVTQNGSIVAGVIDPMEDGRAFRFRPESPFLAGARVKVLVPPFVVRDTEGRFLQDWLTADFLVAAEPRSTLSLTHSGVGAVLPANAALQISFDQPLTPASVSPDSVWLTTHGRLVPGHVSHLSGPTIRFVPDELLVPGERYVLTAGAAIRGLDGQTFSGADVVFTAGPPSDPIVERIEEIPWQGSSAIRLLLTEAITPAEATDLRWPGVADILVASDGRSVILTGERLDIPAPVGRGHRLVHRQRYAR